MREIKKLILHCSDSDFGDAVLIDKWHKERGWKGIGYHYVILNGCRSKDNYKKEDDGLIETGRPIEEAGSHCAGENGDSIGVCLVGRHHFSANQILVGLPKLIKEIFLKYGILAGQTFGHYELDKDKTCPNIDMDIFKYFIRRMQ